MGNSILGIGVTGLNAAQAGLLTTGHNISNANTAGFSRQQAIQSNSIPQLTGSGFLGQGSQIATVRRVYSEFLSNQVLQAQTQSSQLDSYYAQIRQIDNLLADPESGLSPALQGFFRGVQSVAANPGSVPSRQAMLSSAESLVSRFQSINQRFTEVRDGVNGQIASTVTEINALAKQIADLNHDISVVEGAAAGQPANDLLDQRDALVTQLGKLANASAVRQSDGSYNVFIGNGQALVVGTQTLTLTTMPSPNDASQLSVGYVIGGNKVMIPESTLQGGSLGGYFAFRSEMLDSAQNALGRVAISLAQTFNDQHQLGQDLNGAIGGAFFSAPTPGVLQDTGTISTITAVISNAGNLTTGDYRFGFDGTNYRLTRLSDNVSITTTTPPSGAAPFTMDGVSITGVAGVASGDGFVIQPTRGGARDIAVAVHDTAKIAAAAPVRTSALLINTGAGTISAGTVNTPSPVNVNLQQPVTITFHTPYDGQFDVTGTGTGLPASNQTYTAGADISFNGWTMQISGAPAGGDIFTVTPNISGKSDNRNALLLAGLQTKDLIAGGTASYQSAYGQLVSQIGNKTRELEVASSAQENLVTQTRQTQQSLSGVNLDEEAANLMRYQQAYQASAKVIQTASLLFQSILDIGK